MSEKFGLENSVVRGTQELPVSVFERANLMYSDHLIDAMSYCYNDIVTTINFTNYTNKLSIKKVIFNDPATIVYWGNGERTIIKCNEDDSFDQEKGLAMAICKRALSADYKKVFKEWIPEEEEEEVKPMSIEECIEAINRALNTSKLFKFESEPTIEIKQPEGLAIGGIDDTKLTVED